MSNFLTPLDFVSNSNDGNILTVTIYRDRSFLPDLKPRIYNIWVLLDTSTFSLRILKDLNGVTQNFSSIDLAYKFIRETGYTQNINLD